MSDKAADSRLFVSLLLLFCTVLGCSTKSAKNTARLPANATFETTTAEHPSSDLPDDSDSAQLKAAASQAVAARPTLPALDLGGSWTTRRLIVLAQRGPAIIDVSLSIGHESLQQANDRAVARVTQELVGESASPFKWEQLLEFPLVRSGWLGNLVGEDQQRQQLISMYDTQRDDEASPEELKVFFSRGLARGSVFQVSDIGEEPNSTIGQSPWGKADRNHDFTLDSEELTRLSDAVRQFDLNADGIVSLREVNEPSSLAPQNVAMARPSMLHTTTLLVADEMPEQGAKALDSAHRKLASDVLRHYTFLPELSRQLWSNCDESTWNALDENGDQRLVRGELEKLTTISPDVHLYVRLPALDEAETDVSLHAVPRLSNSSLTWTSSLAGGQLLLGDCSIRVQVSDAFSPHSKRQLRRQFESVLEDPQLRPFFSRQLQLNEGAIELLDSDLDQRLSDDEFESGWRWLALRQAARLRAQWMVSGQPWFQLADADADERLTEPELRLLAERFAQLDRNGDHQLTPNELPLVAKLEFVRRDQRLSGQFALPTDDRAIDFDWFSAMDTNRDNHIGLVEFLGDAEEFAGLDRDKSGFLTRAEVY